MLVPASPIVEGSDPDKLAHTAAIWLAELDDGKGHHSMAQIGPPALAYITSKGFQNKYFKNGQLSIIYSLLKGLEIHIISENVF